MNKNCYTDLLRHACTVHADLPALHIKRNGSYQTWTYADFRADLNRLTSVLLSHGLGKGQNAAVIGENSPEWVIAHHAIFLTGACTVPIDQNIPAEEIESIIAITEAEVVFCAPLYAGLFRSLKGKYRHIREIIVFGSEAFPGTTPFSMAIGKGDASCDALSASFAPEDPMVIIFTSGTTGKAKGVVLCQRNFTPVANHAIPRMKLGAGDVVLSVLPLHHVFGFAASVSGPLCGGMAVVFVPAISAPLILEALRDKRVTMLPAVPKMVALFYEAVFYNVKKKGAAVRFGFSSIRTLSKVMGNSLPDPLKKKLFASVHSGFGGSLKLIISGGAALNRKYWEGFRQMGFDIVEGYGLTETYGPITVSPPGSPQQSVGPILPGNEVSIRDSGEDGIGEILLRGACVFAGYYKNYELTREAIDAEGWFHTGDLGFLDAAGFLHIAGRKKDVIVLDTGKNVYPDELEDYYEQSPVIEEIGVFGAKNNDAEIVAAVVLPNAEIRKMHTIVEATGLVRNELIRMAKQVPVHRRISDFVVVFQPLPRTTTRKLKKKDLQALYASIRRRSAGKPFPEDQLSVLETALMETAEYRLVLESLAAVARIDHRAITPRSHFEADLGLDSLNRVELIAEVEKRTGLVCPDDYYAKMETVGDLVFFVKESEPRRSPLSAEKVLDFKQRILDLSYYRIQLPPPESAFVAMVKSPARFAAKTFLRASARYHYPPAYTPAPVIFVANHPNELDPFLLLSALPGRIAAHTFFLGDNAAGSRLGDALFGRNCIRTSRPYDLIEALKISLALLREGKNCILFPEGKVTPHDRVAAFKPGIGLVAKETRAQLVPVRISGHRLLFGNPFTWSELDGAGRSSPELSAQEIANLIKARILAL